MIRYPNSNYCAQNIPWSCQGLGKINEFVTKIDIDARTESHQGAGTYLLFIFVIVNKINSVMTCSVCTAGRRFKSPFVVVNDAPTQQNWMKYFGRS